jgi:hypothetical protein
LDQGLAGPIESELEIVGIPVDLEKSLDAVPDADLLGLLLLVVGLDFGFNLGQGGQNKQHTDEDG